MATQTDVDRLQIAWQRFVDLFNVVLPGFVTRLRALRNRFTSSSGSGSSAL